MTDTEQQFARLYRARRVPELVEVPPASFLMINEHGDPYVTESYRAAVRALYAISYAIKFTLQRGRRAQLPRPPLEGLWWAADMASQCIVTVPPLVATAGSRQCLRRPVP